MKILIISNACFSNVDSNGRTLANLFSGFDKKDLAQFFVYGNPDFSVCDNYYRVSDRDALNSCIKLKPCGGKVLQKTEEKSDTSETLPPAHDTGGVKKTPLSKLFREVAWSMGRWKGKNLNKWIDDFSPDAIFIFLGDNAFLCKLASRIAKRKNIPIYVCSTEDYAFKNYNYITRRPSLFYSIFHTIVKKSCDRMEKYVKLGLFNTPLLAEKYAENYSYPCKCVFNSSSVEFIENAEVSKPARISYLGNMGLNRHKPLIEIANTAALLLPDTKLDIYGALPNNPEAKEELLSCENINYKGFVGYDEVVNVLHQSTLLVHAEYNDEYYTKDLRYAFSTKIADSVCCGTPFLLYADESLACTDFVSRNNCAFICHTSDKLKDVLKLALTDEEARKSVLAKAKKTREEYLTQKDTLYKLICETNQNQ